MNAHVCRCPNKVIHRTDARATRPSTSNSAFRYSGIQNTSQTSPNPPVATNAHCQPHRSAIHGTSNGVRIAPVLVPALNIPVANARSLCGNHSATALMDPGKIADGDAPRDYGRRQPSTHTDQVDHPTGDEKTECVREAEPGDNVAVVSLSPTQLELQSGRQDAQHLTIDVVDRRR